MAAGTGMMMVNPSISLLPIMLEGAFFKVSDMWCVIVLFIYMCAKPSNTWSSFTRHNKFCYRAWARASPINHQLLHGMHSKVITLNMDDKLDYSHTIPGLLHRISPCTFIARIHAFHQYGRVGRRHHPPPPSHHQHLQSQASWPPPLKSMFSCIFEMSHVTSCLTENIQNLFGYHNDCCTTFWTK